MMSQKEGMIWVTLDLKHIRSFIINIYYNLCDYSHAYILIEGTVTVPNTVAVVASVN